MTTIDTTREAQIEATRQEAAEDARLGREPAVYRTGDSYLSAESGHIIGSDIGAVYVETYRAVADETNPIDDYREPVELDVSEAPEPGSSSVTRWHATGHQATVAMYVDAGRAAVMTNGDWSWTDIVSTETPLDVLRRYLRGEMVE